ncbi:MAG: hypothetical protein JSV60_06320, partial [Desulfobacterales bacterium]
MSPHLPVIIVSAYDSFLDDPRVSLADGYVIKSIHLYTLKENIACVLIQQNGYRGPAEAGFVIPNFAFPADFDRHAPRTRSAAAGQNPRP